MRHKLQYCSGFFEGNRRILLRRGHSEEALQPLIDRHITAVLEDFREALEGILQGAGVIDEGLVLAGVNIIVELNPYLIPKGKRV